MLFTNILSFFTTMFSKDIFLRIVQTQGCAVKSADRLFLTSALFK